MNAALPIAEAMPTATPFSAVKFEAFRICEAGGATRRTTYPLGEIPGRDLNEALNAVLAKCLLLHKEHLAIRVTDERGARVHLYAIKRKSAPDYRTEGHRVVAVRQLYAAFLCTMDGGLVG